MPLLSNQPWLTIFHTSTIKILCGSFDITGLVIFNWRLSRYVDLTGIVVNAEGKKFEVTSMSTRSSFATAVGAIALSLMSSAIVMAQTTTSTSTNSSTNSSSNSSSSNIQGCGNSGKPGCPPKECPPGHGDINPAGHPDCKKQQSGS